MTVITQADIARAKDWEGVLNARYSEYEGDAAADLAADFAAHREEAVAGLVGALRKILYYRPAGDISKCVGARKIVENLEKIAASALDDYDALAIEKGDER